MTRITLTITAGAVLLAGCSGGGNADADANGEVSVKEAAKEAERQGMRPEPGLYKTTVTMKGLDIPGMPPEMADHGAGLTTTVEDCLTQEEVDKGFEELVKQGQDGDCTYEKFDLSGGAIDAVMVCKADGRSTRMEMTGQTTPTSADITATMAMDFDGVGEGTMTFNAKHERIGECKVK
jgi:hypothetical protein